jgi:hypothetical protein
VKETIMSRIGTFLIGLGLLVAIAAFPATTWFSRPEIWSETGAAAGSICLMCGAAISILGGLVILVQILFDKD